MEIIEILGFLVFFVLGMMLGNIAIETIANTVCKEYKEVPVRIEIYGLYGMEREVETTKESMDKMGKVCATGWKAHEHDMIDNLLYIISQYRDAK